MTTNPIIIGGGSPRRRLSRGLALGAAVIALFAVGPAQAQFAKLSARSAQNLQTLKVQIADKPATTAVKPWLTEAATVVAPPAPPPPAATSETSAPPLAPTESTPPAAMATEAVASVPVDAAAAAVPAAASLTLASRTLYHLQLDKGQEQKASAALAELVLPTQAAGTDPAVAQKALGVFPGIVRQLDADQVSVDLKPYAVAGEPMTLDRSSGEYVGSVKIGVADLFDRQEGRELSAPMTFQLVEAAFADPTFVVLRQTSPPLATIRIHTKSLSNPFVVRVASQFDQSGVPVTLSITPTLFVRLDRHSIQGFGLETARVFVSTLGIAQPAGIVVTLEADPSAHFADSELVLDKNGRADTILRSDASGPANISVSAAGFSDANYQMSFEPPWRTIWFSLAGGLVGGLIRIAPGLRRGFRRDRAAVALLVAVLIGSLVFGLIVLGVNVLPVTFAVRVGYVFVAVVSAVGAWMGTAALKPIHAAA
jgi:hypothetical protein